MNDRVLEIARDPTRLGALRLTGLLDSPPEESFDRLTRLAADLLDVQGSLVTLLDEDRQFFKSSHGLAEPWRSRGQTPLSHSYCKFVVADGAAFVVENAREHPLVQDNPAIEDLGVVAYLGVPLRGPEGETLGSFAVFDTEPREWESREVQRVKTLGAAVEAEIWRSAPDGDAESYVSYRKLVDDLPIGVLVHRDGNVLLTNRKALEILGLEDFDPSEDLSLLDFVAPEDRERVRSQARRVQEDRDEIELQRYRVAGADGVTRAVEATAVPAEMDGEPVVQVAIRDITEQQEAERRFTQVFEQSPVGIALVSPDGGLLEANQALADLLGYERADLSGTNLAEFTHPEDLEKDLDLARRVSAGEIDGYQIRKRYVTPGQDVVWADLRVAPLEVSGEDVFHLVGFATDVTRQRELEEELRARTERYERLFTEISDVVTVLDEDGTIRYESPSIERVFGYAPDELIGRPAFDLVHPDDLDAVAEAFFAAVEGEGVPERTVQYRFRHADGSWRQVESTGVLPEDETFGPVIVTRDITDRVRAQQKYRAIFETNPSPIGLAKLETGEFIEVNSAFLELLGHTREEVVGATADELGVWARPEQRGQIVDRLRGTGSVHNVDAQFQDAEGERIDVLFSGSILELAGDRYLVGVAQDITQRKAFERALQHRTLHDQLTELPNRILFRDRLLHAHQRAEREGDQIAVLFLDLDRFKTVNDSLGHAAGDRVLRMVADRLTETLRGEDTVARVGGDEFAILLETMSSEEDIDRAVSRIRQAFEVPYEVEDTAFSLTASIGVAHSGIEVGDPHELVRLADAAMYRVKRPGSTDYHTFDPSRDREVTEQLQREAALEWAVEEEQFVLHYQPVVRLETGEIVGAEALVRWRHPERGLVRPGEFIPLAEETGLIVPLGQWVLEESLRQHRRWRENGVVDDDRFRVSVNLSPRQHEAGGINDKIRTATREAGASLSDLMVEITETVAMTGADTFQPLREEGLAVGIDDFGTGYSSLEYLRHFDADVLKLDRSFTAHLAAPDRTARLVEGILYVAENIGLRVTAEGIETTEQLEILREFGCPYGQGYLFSRAVTPDEFAELYRD